MIKVFLVDADGVIVDPRQKYFSQRLSEDFGIPPENVLEFFKKDFHACIVGQGDLREKIAPYVKEWGWKDSVDALLEYWFAGERSLNQRVSDFTQILRQRGIACYLATDQERYRAKYLWETAGLDKLLNGAFFSHDIGFEKSDSRFFEAVHKRLVNVDYPEMVYWDDDENNIETARALGVHAFLYEGFENALARTEGLLK